MTSASMVIRLFTVYIPHKNIEIVTSHVLIYTESISFFCPKIPYLTNISNGTSKNNKRM